MTLLRTLGLAVITASFLSCASGPKLSPTALDFFVTASNDNPWNRKIQDWQARHEGDRATTKVASKAPTKLSDEYKKFVNRVRLEVVAETVAWVQEQSRESYRPDGEVDHWATLGEVMETGGDDCDGLDLLTFILLRKLGFAEDEIYRAIVVETATGQHHMVTLWFDGETPKDPLLLDPTGVVTSAPARLSAIPGWEPIELFDERAHFAVTTLGKDSSTRPAASARAR